jgi:methylated-DNA-[protein]-cysteine S-methyltransferase
MTQLQYEMGSKVGPLYLVASEKGLQGIFWRRQKIPIVTRLEGTSSEMKYLIQAVQELSEYLLGKRRDFDITLDIVGTDFQKKVWVELCKIPYGKTVSYKYIANGVNDPNACRAVGSANGKNPLSIIVPCHRVIASDGTLGGYFGGLDVKKRLLALEQGGSL